MGKVAKVMLSGVVVLGLVLSASAWYLKSTHQLESAVKEKAEQIDAEMAAKGYKALGVGTGITLITSPAQIQNFNKNYGTQCEDKVAHLEGVWESTTAPKVKGYVSESTVNVLKDDEKKPKQTEAHMVIAAAAKEARYALTRAHEEAMKELSKHNVPSAVHELDKAAVGHLYLKKKVEQPDPKMLVEAAQRAGVSLYACQSHGQVKFIPPHVDDWAPSP